MQRYIDLLRQIDGFFNLRIFLPNLIIRLMLSEIFKRKKILALKSILKKKLFYIQINQWLNLNMSSKAYRSFTVSFKLKVIKHSESSTISGTSQLLMSLLKI